MDGRVMLVLLASILVSSPAEPAAAGNSRPGALTPRAAGAPSAAKVFAKLFRPAPTPVASQSPAQPPSTARTPKVVCGMTLIPGAAAIDPGIATRTSKSDTRFTIRAIQPTSCWPD